MNPDSVRLPKDSRQTLTQQHEKRSIINKKFNFGARIVSIRVLTLLG